MENFVPVHMLAPGSVHVVFYEELVENPGREVERLTELALEIFALATSPCACTRACRSFRSRAKSAPAFG